MEHAPVPEIRSQAHLAIGDLEHGRTALPAAPLDVGRLHLVCSRLEGNRRWLPARARLDPETGLQHDRWYRAHARGVERYGALYADMQIATMQFGIASLVANGQPLALFGDNLFVDLDLSQHNLPTGSTLAIGEARLVVTAEPHDGCKQFRARFGSAALRFVAARRTRHLNLRGIYLRVVEAGEIRVGDDVRVLGRPPSEGSPA